jgi:hypothetical protein
VLLPLFVINVSQNKDEILPKMICSYTEFSLLDLVEEGLLQAIVSEKIY